MRLLRMKPEDIRFRVAVLVLSALFLCFLFSSRPIRLKPELMTYSLNPTPVPSTAIAGELIKIENQKAVDEIKLRMEQEDSWFHNKFILVGGLLALFLGYVGFGFGEQPVPRTYSNKHSDERLKEILKSNWTCSVLALATVVAFAIDMHIRSNITVIQQMALWIAHYAEPAALQIPFDPNKTDGYLPWEQFLRIEVPGSGLHRDEVHGLAYNTHLHYLTGVLYILYFLVLQNVCLLSRKDKFHKNKSWKDEDYKQRRAQQQIAFTLFLFVHVSAAAFTWIAHSAPSAFEIKLIPWINGLWVTGLNSILFYMIPVILLVLINLPYIRILLPAFDGKSAVEKKNH